MTDRFPDRINPATLAFSAAAAIDHKQKSAGSPTPT